jgi:hypothetical protein
MVRRGSQVQSHGVGGGRRYDRTVGLRKWLFFNELLEFFREVMGGSLCKSHR